MSVPSWRVQLESAPLSRTRQARNVEGALKSLTLFRSAPHPIGRIFELCGQSSMHVLGVSNADDSVVIDPSWVRVNMDANTRIPQVRCAKASSIQIILFQRPLPTRMQYISLNPIALALGDKPTDERTVPVGEAEAQEEIQERLRREKSERLVEKLKQHSIIKRPASNKERALPRIVNQINWSSELELLLQKNVSRLGARPKRSLSVSERVVESATTMKNIVLLWIWELITVYLYPIIRRGFIFGLIGHRIAAEMLLVVLEWRPQPHIAALKDISATAQQVEIRLQQFCYWPMQYVTLRQRKNDWESVTTSHPDYIRFYNSLWLVANDVIIGIALGSYIIDNASWVADQISLILTAYTVEALQSGISWLMGWPAGLKLNTELAAFLGDLFLWVIDYWASKLLRMFANAYTCLLTFSRLHRHLPAGAAWRHLVHRLHQFCRSQHAHRGVLGLAFHPYRPYILFLPRLRPYISLATDNPHLAIPSFQRKEAQRPAEPYRLVRLRP